jgi:DNA-binding beta-propeller fold protein YncE
VAALLPLLACCILPGSAWASGTVYVTNFGSNLVPSTVSQYETGADGQLSPLTPATVGAGFNPIGLAVSPDGKSVYVANSQASPQVGISQYDVDPSSGALTPKTPATVASAPFAWDIAVTPDGTSAYVANQDGLVSQYDIDPQSGALSPKTPATVDAGVGSQSLAVSPDGKSVYVVNDAEGTVSQYTIDPVSGALLPKTPATVPIGGGGVGAFGIAVSPDSKNAYVTKAASQAISQYDIDPVSGALSPKTPALVAAGDFPFDIAVSPDGRSAYATD